jgi:ABC-type antimicrobial peptide transport system permease subunit
LFAAVAALLALTGLYAVLAHTVAARRDELAVRMVLGAEGPQVVRLFVARGLRITLLGAVVGLLIATAANRLLRSLLVGVSPIDPVTFALVAGGVLAAGILASLIPALRAAKVDPLRSLAS